MPRERIIHGERTEQQLTPEQVNAGRLPRGVYRTPSLDLTWDRGESFLHGGAVRVEFEAPREWLEMIQADGLPSTTETMLWVSFLNRADINKFIRTLRRARDAAYGGDE